MHEMMGRQIGPSHGGVGTCALLEADTRRNSLLTGNRTTQVPTKYMNRRLHQLSHSFAKTPEHSSQAPDNFGLSESLRSMCACIDDLGHSCSLSSTHEVMQCCCSVFPSFVASSLSLPSVTRPRPLHLPSPNPFFTTSLAELSFLTVLQPNLGPEYRNGSAVYFVSKTHVSSLPRTRPRAPASHLASLTTRQHRPPATSPPRAKRGVLAGALYTRTRATLSAWIQRHRS